MTLSNQFPGSKGLLEQAVVVRIRITKRLFLHKLRTPAGDVDDFADEIGIDFCLESISSI